MASVTWSTTSVEAMNSKGNLTSVGGFVEADYEILVKVVKMAQWQHAVGTEGSWKQFLSRIDKETPHTQHDPAKRSWNVLASFVQTLQGNPYIEMAGRIRDWAAHSQKSKMSDKFDPWPATPEQELVRLTREHPRFNRDYVFPSYQKGWVFTDRGTAKDAATPESMVSLDCEMVDCADGSREVVRLCAVDRDCNTLINTLVQPSKDVVNFKSDITGVAADDLKDVTVTQTSAQEQVRDLLTPGTILVGHSLHYDLKVLKIDHKRVIDTGYIYHVRNRPKILTASLRNLCKIVFGYDFRDNSKPHNCLDDAILPMRLILHRLEYGEIPPLSLLTNQVDERKMSQLFFHRVPLFVKNKDLESLFPSNFFCILQDIGGRPQKKICLHGKHKGKWIHVMVRKMDVDGDEFVDQSPQSASFEQKINPVSNEQSLHITAGNMATSDNGGIHDTELKQAGRRKRKGGASQQVTMFSTSTEYLQKEKRSKECDCEHYTEVLKLRKQLDVQSEELQALQKIVTALTRKQKLL